MQKQLKFIEKKKMDSLLDLAGLKSMKYIFGIMERAEKIIDEFKEKYPEKEELIDGCFQYLQPPPAIRKRNPILYDAYAKEIIQRVIDGEPLEPGTDAELLVAFSEISLKAPFNPEGATAYNRLFQKRFPDKVESTYDYEAYPGSVEEIYDEMRTKLARPRGCRNKS